MIFIFFSSAFVNFVRVIFLLLAPSKSATHVFPSFFLSHSGILILVLAYTAMGSILFMTLEGEDTYYKTVETAVAASKPRTDIVNSDIRTR